MYSGQLLFSIKFNPEKNTIETTILNKEIIPKLLLFYNLLIFVLF